MSILNQTDLQELQNSLSQQSKDHNFHRILAFLLFADNSPPQRVATTLGISLCESAELFVEFELRMTFNLRRPKSTEAGGEVAGIEKTPGVRGGSARVSGTRISVWQLVADRDLGVSEVQLLLDYPSLRAKDIVNAWSYAESHHDEILAEIHENEVAAPP